jgi:hypothetical protein
VTIGLGDRRPLAGQRLDRVDVVDAVQVLDEPDDVASDGVGLAAAAIPDLLLGIDGEAVIPSAPGTSTDAIDLAAKFDAAAGDLVLDADGARLRLQCACAPITARSPAPRLSYECAAL